MYISSAHPEFPCRSEMLPWAHRKYPQGPLLLESKIQCIGFSMISKRPMDTPRGAHGSSRRCPAPPKEPLRAPNAPQGHPEGPPGTFQDVPCTPQGTPESSQRTNRSSGTPKKLPRTHKEHPRTFSAPT